MLIENLIVKLILVFLVLSVLMCRAPRMVVALAAARRG